MQTLITRLQRAVSKLSYSVAAIALPCWQGALDVNKPTSTLVDGGLEEGRDKSAKGEETIKVARVWKFKSLQLHTVNNTDIFW